MLESDIGDKKALGFENVVVIWFRWLTNVFYKWNELLTFRGFIFEAVILVVQTTAPGQKVIFSGMSDISQRVNIGDIDIPEIDVIEKLPKYCQ